MDATFTHVHCPLPRTATLAWLGPIPLRLRGYHPLCRNFSGHFGCVLGCHIAMPKHHISRRIQFRLFPFRSPLLGKSQLISLPRGTKMLQFPRFDLHRPCDGVSKRTGFPFGHLGIIGCVRLPRAFRSLPRPSSLLKPSNSSTGVFTPAYSATYYTTMHDDHRRYPGGYPLHPSYVTFVTHCIDAVKTCASVHNSGLRR